MNRLLLGIALVVMSICAAPQNAVAQRWVQATLPAPYDQGFYLDIFFLESNPLRGWACDMDSGYVVRTTDGGQTWSGSRVVPPGRVCHLEYVQFFPNGVGYTCGPGGLFKSTDNGVTWTSVTLPALLSARWGAWFKDSNEGWVTGGGCGNNVFARTTNGGASFTTFRSTTPTSSNLSDPLWQPTMPAGEVIAIGNGTLWKSTDMGVSWFVQSSTGSTNPWHEEITRFGSTIMVANASSNCSPANYSGGGARWSHNNGQTWSSFETQNPMYGAYLLSNSKAWIAGMNANVWYTSNGGANWELRNCGLKGRHMDDVTFISDSVGWLAGEGLFYLAPARRYVTPKELTLTEDCPGTAAIDTIWVHNEDFYDAPWESEFIGEYEYLYKVVNVLPYPLPKCDSTPMVIQYRGRDMSTRDAQLRIHIYNPDSTEVIATLYVDLSGRMRRLTAAPQSDTVEYQVRVGQTTSRALDWSRTELPEEEIALITVESGDSTISLTGALPLKIRAAPDFSRTVVEATPVDTGWVETRFRVRLMPCERDTFVTVRVLGLSPIINAPRIVTVDAACQRDGRLHIPIKNTGNIALSITEAYVSGRDASAFTVIGMKSGRPGPPWTVPVGGSDTLVLSYTARTGSEVAQLILENDDYTTTRGDVSPWTVDLMASTESPSFTIQPALIDLGVLCVGQVKDSALRIRNTGAAQFLATTTAASANVRGLSASPQPVAPKTDLLCRFQWSSSRPGDVTDTIYVLVAPCDSIVPVEIRARVVDDSIDLTPAVATLTSSPGVLVEQTFVITTPAAQPITVTSLRLTPAVAGATIVAPPTPFVVNRGDQITVIVRWTPSAEGTATAVLRAETPAACKPDARAVLTFVSTELDISVDQTALQMLALCTPIPVLDTVRMQSSSMSPLTLRAPRIVESGVPFRVVSPIQASVVQPGTSLDVVVEFDAAAAVMNGPAVAATLRLQTELGATWTDVALRGRAQSAVIDGDTTLDAGVVYHCGRPVTRTFKLVNLGTLPDVVDADPATIPKGWSLSATRVVLAPGGSTTIDAVCDPSQLPAGISRGVVAWRSTTCSDRVDVTLQANLLDDGQLLVQPSSISFGTVLLGDRAVQTVTLENRGASPRFITSLTLTPAGQGWSVASTPASVRAGATETIDVLYEPTQAGAHTAQLMVIDVGVCPDTHIVELSAEAIERPRFTARIRVDRYRVNPYDVVNVPVQFVDDIRAAGPDRITVSIAYSPILFDVTGVTSTYADAAVTAQIDRGVVTITADRVGPSFGASGNLAVIAGSAIPSIPDSTVLDVQGASVTAREAVEVEEIDGLLHINLCGPYNSIRFRSPTTIQMGAPHPVVDRVQLDVDAHADQQCMIRLVDPAGVVVSTWGQRFVASGQSVLSLPVGDIPTGMYVVDIRTSMGGIFTLPVVILR